jgi:16S rRNA (cytidine1402-2'-O)-methyltransferase
MGNLYLVATPIGNLEDISLRALRILGEVSLIAAEDTRHSRKLLTHFHISTPTLSYHEHSREARRDRLVEALAVGDIALISDAGTPAISDPGQDLVMAAIRAGHTVVPIPGPSAAISALIASGLSTERFTFIGFLPRRSKERRALLAEISALPYTLIFYEAPHRLLACLDDLLAVLGDRRVAVAHELTKLHEDIARGSLEEVRGRFRSATAGPRGEYVIVVAGLSKDDIEGAAPLPDGLEAEPTPRTGGSAAARDLLMRLLASGYRTRAAAAETAKATGISKRSAYRLALEIERESGED